MKILRRQSRAHVAIPVLAGVGLLLLGFTACSPAPERPDPDRPLAASLSLSTNTITVGDPVRADLTIWAPTGATLHVPEPGGDSPVDTLERVIEDPVVRGGEAVHRRRYVLTAYDTGEFVLGTNTLRASLDTGETLHAPYPFATLRVRSVLGGTNAVLRPAKDPVAPPPDWPRWVLVFGAIALAALAIGLLTRALARRHRPRAAPAPPPEPPYVLARRALARLRERGWMEQGEVDAFYVELSSIVRRYLEGRFDIRAPEQTTEEFIRDVASSRRLSAEHQTRVTAFLEQSDLVKFARHRPGLEDMQNALRAAEQLVDETAPAPQAEGGPAA